MAFAIHQHASNPEPSTSPLPSAQVVTGLGALPSTETHLTLHSHVVCLCYSLNYSTCPKAPFFTSKIFLKHSQQLSHDFYVWTGCYLPWENNSIQISKYFIKSVSNSAPCSWCHEQSECPQFEPESQVWFSSLDITLAQHLPIPINSKEISSSQRRSPPP